MSSYRRKLSPHEVVNIKYQIENGTDRVIVENKEIGDNLLIKDISAEHVAFHNIDFNENVSLANISAPGKSVNFMHCTFSKLITLNECGNLTIEFSHCKIEAAILHRLDMKKLGFTSSSCNWLHSRSSKFHSLELSYNRRIRAEFDSLVCEHLHVAGNSEDFELFVNENSDFDDEPLPSIQHFSIELTPAFTGGIYVNGTTIENLKITGHLNKAVVSLLGNTYHHILIDKFINSGTFRISNAYFTRHSLVRVSESDFGKAVLFGIDFNSIHDLYVVSTSFSDCVYSEVKWCTTIANDPEKEMSFSQLREMYKQLKNIAAKQNDKPDELKFYALEMNAYHQEHPISSKQANDRIILFFNRFTNNHGQSWLRPLGITIVSILVLYFPIKALLGYTQFEPSLANITVAISEMIECANPIRKFSDSFGQPGPRVDAWRISLAKIIDTVFLRLLVGLLIFQMIKAFRKFVK